MRSANSFFTLLTGSRSRRRKSYKVNKRRKSTYKKTKSIKTRHRRMRGG